MTTPIFWLSVAAIVVLLYFVVILADNIFQKGMGAGRKFWRRHIIADFPYPDICFDCKKGDCAGCGILKWHGAVYPAYYFDVYPSNSYSVLSKVRHNRE